jgi:hypothetical protein
MKLNGIQVDGKSIVNAINYYYPKGLVNPSVVENKKLYNYVILFGIRVATCDSGMPDDIIGALKYTKSVFGDDYWDIVLSSASTDPSPQYVKTPMAQAKSLGGTAWVKEGQYFYVDRGMWNGYPAFAPKTVVQVYRWNPTQEQIRSAISSGKGLSFAFEAAKLNGSAKLGTCNDCLIHRSWNTRKFINDSAGCQIFSDNTALNKIGKWGKEHKSIYGDKFTYTLLAEKEFTQANKQPTFSTKIPTIKDILNIKF